MADEEFYKMYKGLPEEKKGIIDALMLHFYPEENKPGNWIPVSEAAGILGVSGQTIRQKIKVGIIPYKNSSQRKTVVDRATVERLAQMQ